jgi:predicted dehydrogenase
MGIQHPEFGQDPESAYGVLSQAKEGKIVTEKLATIKPPTYGAFYRSLAESLKTGVAAPVPATDGLKVIYLVELARQSALSGQTLEVRL